MLLPNNKVITGIKHQNSISSIFHFENNNKQHYISISISGELQEWGYEEGSNNLTEIGPCVLVRPSDDILSANNHPITKLQKNDFISITSCIQFKNFIALGYEDGLVLVYQQNIQDWKSENTEENKSIPCYSNYFSLYYILLGHTQRISALYYIEQMNMLVTASDNCIVKIYDMETGHSLYHFNLDCIVSHIFYFERKKDKLLTMICEEPYKLVINFGKEPLSFNHYTFKYNEICNIIQSKNGFYLLGKSSVIYYFNNNFDYVDQYNDNDNVEYLYMIQFKDNFIIFDISNFVRFATINESKKCITNLFKIQIGNDNINTCYLTDDKYLFMGSQDCNIYFDNIEDEFNLFWNKSRMMEEEKLSEEYNKFLANRKGKGVKGAAKGKGKGEKLPKIKK